MTNAFETPTDAEANASSSVLSRPLEARWRTSIAAAAVAPSLVLTLFCLAARASWFFDGWTAFVPYIAAVSAGGLLVALLTRRAGWSAVASGLLLWNGWLVASQFGDGPTGRSPDVTVMTINVLTSNRQFERFSDLVRGDPPDIMAVLETDAEWVTVLDDLRDLYPHRISRGRGDNFGLAVCSRFPLTGGLIKDEEGDHAIDITADIGGRPLRLLAVHPIPPSGGRHWARRNRQLAGFARRAAKAEGPFVLLGDFNLPPWSPFYRDLLRDGHLRETRHRGRGLGFTWNAKLWWMNTIIDHVFISGGVSATSCDLTSPFGSDHLGVRVGLMLPHQ